MLLFPVKSYLHHRSAVQLLSFHTLPKNAPLTPFVSHSLLFHIFRLFVFNHLRTQGWGGRWGRPRSRRPRHACSDFVHGDSMTDKKDHTFRQGTGTVKVRRHARAAALKPTRHWPAGYIESFAGVPADFARPPQGGSRQLAKEPKAVSSHRTPKNQERPRSRWT